MQLFFDKCDKCNFNLVADGHLRSVPIQFSGAGEHEQVSNLILTDWRLANH